MLVRTIASETPVNSSFFAGTEFACTEGHYHPYCFYSKNFQHVVDISSFTLEQPAQIQVFMAAHTSDQTKNDGLTFMGRVYYNFKFVLHQTDYSFKPRDARDPASDWPQNQFDSFQDGSAVERWAVTASVTIEEL